MAMKTEWRSVKKQQNFSLKHKNHKSTKVEGLKVFFKV